MRKILILVTGALLLSASAFSQDKVSVFAGYSLLQVETRTTQNKIWDGWDVELAGKAYHFLSLVGDVSTHYASGSATGENLHLRVRTFLAGPRVSFDLHHVRPFADVLFGVSHLRLGVTVVPGTGLVGAGGKLSPAGENGFTIALGGGLDVPINRFISIRPAKLEYVSIDTGSVPAGFGDPVTELSTGHTNNLRYSAGLVLRF
jgi:hypothetical protein